MAFFLQNITFYLCVFHFLYIKKTPFALEPRTVEFQGTTDYNRTISAIVDKIGDMLAKPYIYMEIGSLAAGAGTARFCDDVARAMFEYLTLNMGNVQFDKIEPEYMHAHEELTTDVERQLGRLTGKSSSVAELVTMAQNTQYFYLPLDFYFADDYGAALPLVALHLTDVKITGKLRPKADIIIGNPDPYVVLAADATILDMHLLFETVILDDPERDWFANTPLKYLITQHQFLGANTIRSGSTNATIDVVFNHPVKELNFMFRSATNLTAKNYFNFVGEETGNLLGEAFATMQLLFNGQQRVTPQGPLYFRVVQNKNHHTRIPNKHIYTYSFALYPQDPNPTGSANFSRIDTVRMLFTFGAALADNYDFLLFATNVNTATVHRGVMLLSFAS